MAILESQKVDYLWKKLGYGRTKTDVNAKKKAFNESIPSPLLLRGDKIWAQSDLIPATIPAATPSGGVVTVYSDPVETVADITATTNCTWKTNITDWIPPEIGSTYLVKVYIHDSGDAANAIANGTQVLAAGSGNDDEWFFDYQSGVLCFIGENLPFGIDFTGKSVYITGAVYSGTFGVGSSGGSTSTFGPTDSINTTGIITASSFVGDGSGLTGVITGLTAGANIQIVESGTGNFIITATNADGSSGLVEDTTPELGGDLNLNGQTVFGLGNFDVAGIVTATAFSGSGASLTGIVTSITAGSNINIVESGGDVTIELDTVDFAVEDRTIELGIVDGNAPTTATTWDLGVLFNYHDGTDAKKSAVAWEQSRERFVFARDAEDGGGIGVDNPQLTFNSYATIEVGSIWVNDCAGQSELIACDNGERTLNNITIDAGYF